MTGKLPPHPPEEPWHVHQPFPPHHHHHHDPHHVAPECDDQLAVFSGVGRGLRGDGYKVVIKSDVEAETYLEGLLYDAATNTYSSEWISENINGGQLMYQYNLRPYTNPQTFTITFRYKRPNRSASEWVWTTPAIPYIWDADDDGLADVDGIVGTGVATLFLKKTTDPSWLMVNLPTSHTEAEAITRQEKLLYPDDWTREMFNAPVPGDPWTVNLQYGIGGDIDAPNIEDLAKIIGVNVDFLRDLVEERDLPGSGDTFGTKENGDPMNTKEYIDKQASDVIDHFHKDLFGGVDSTDYADIPSDLKPLDGDGNNGRTVWDWIKYAINKAKQSFIAGPGIQITENQDGSVTITNTQVGGRWITLQEGVDFEYQYHNGWYFGAKQQGNAQDQNPSPIVGPKVRIIPSYALDGQTLTGAQVRINSGSFDSTLNDTAHLINKDDLLSVDGQGNLNKFKFRHSQSVEECPESAIISISFLGDYASLNNLPLQMTTPGTQNIWNIMGTNDPIDSNSATWHSCGACWNVNCNTSKNVNIPNAKTFLISAINIADGYNLQYDAPSYGYDHLCVRSWANFDWYITIG